MAQADTAGAKPAPRRPPKLQKLAEPFEIGGLRVQRGERIQFDLPMAQLYTHAPLDLTVEVYHGRWAGVVLLICAAIHGDELNGVEIIRRLRALKELDRLRGTLVLVPVVNLFGFLNQSRYLPDRRDLNRSFPGREGGSIASRMAGRFFNDVVMRCSHVIDLHTAAIHRDNLPQIRGALDHPGVEEMARGFSIPVIVNAGLIENSLRAEAGKRDIPVITYEAGEALRLDEKSIVTGVRGIVNVMRVLDMLPARRSRVARAEPSVARSTTWFRAPADGVFRPTTSLGTHVAKGDAIGVIASPFSSEDVVLTSPTEGIVICVNKLPLVHEGEALFHIARFSEDAAVEGELAAHESDIEADPLYDLEAITQDTDLA